MEVKRDNKKFIRVHNLCIGEVFEINGNLYLKIQDHIIRTEGERTCRAVRLKRGSLHTFPRDTKVMHIRGCFQEGDPDDC